MKTTYSVLSCDPGKVNFGYAVLSITVYPSGNIKTKIEVSGMIKNPIADLTGVNGVTEKAKIFRSEIKKIVAKYKVQAIIAERFMNRGRGGGNTAEMVNVMLGVLASFPQPLTLVVASQWKNAFNKNVGDLNFVYDNAAMCAHRVDAALIGIYYGAYLIKAKKHYPDFTVNKVMKLLKTAKEA